MPGLDIGGLEVSGCPGSPHRSSSRERVKRCDFDAIDTSVYGSEESLESNWRHIGGFEQGHSSGCGPAYSQCARSGASCRYQLAASQPKPPVADPSALVTMAEACRYPLI